MNILITGAAGFIGYHVAQRLLTENHEITLIDNFSNYYDQQLKRHRIAQLTASDSWTLHELDVTDFNKLETIIKGEKLDCIVHLAALAGVVYSLDHGDEYMNTNVIGTYNIFELAKRYSIPKIVYASSASVYGASDRPVNEMEKIDKPVSLYAATKAANELLAYTYHHLFQVKSIGLRFFTAYGPWGRPDMALFIFTKAILEGRHITVNNYGQMSRDWMYIDDIVEGIILSVDYETDYEIFNLGSGKSVNLLDFIKQLEVTLGKKAEKKLVPLPLGDVKMSLADTSKAIKLLGFKAQVDVSQGIDTFVKWYKSYYDIKN